MAKFWFAKQHKLETFDHDIKVVLGVYCLLSRHAYKNMFNLKPLECLVTEPPGVSCVSAGDRELSPLRCSPVCRSEQRVVAADQFLPARAAHSQLCRDPRPVQTCTL